MFSAGCEVCKHCRQLRASAWGQIAFFHSKLTLKRPKVGCAWDWHQDYGYWYRNGYLFPNMASVFIALDPYKKINGCIKVLKVLHHLGRIEHGVNKGQVGADMVRVEQAMKILELVDIEMDPRGALFFHSNVLHASGKTTLIRPEMYC
jgi:ectoine hydroxylase-related dioxygenase (phytanoyl-CoA dioxygenase family)